MHKELLPAVKCVKALTQTPKRRETESYGAQCQAQATAIPALLMVPSTRIVEGIFSPEGTKVGFVVRGEILPVQAGALLQWGCANWKDDRRLAQKWRVSYVLGAPDWLKKVAGDAQPPKGVRLAFL